MRCLIYSVYFISAPPFGAMNYVLKKQDGSVVSSLDGFCKPGYVAIIGNRYAGNPSNAGLFCVATN